MPILRPEQLIDELYGPPKKESRIEDFKKKGVTKPDKTETWETELEEKLTLREQYEEQIEILKQAGILEKLSSGEMGIIDINGREKPIPAYSRIQEQISQNQEILEKKREQGFNQLLLVPFGLKLDSLIAKYEQVIREHHQQSKLLAAKKEPTDSDEPLELDEDRPIWVWTSNEPGQGYNNADTEGKIFYYPKEFSQNHQGRTKQELLETELSSGWNILLTEDLPNIPRKNQGKETAGRHQIDTAGTSIKQYIKQGEEIPCPAEYLTAIQSEPAYQNEQGLTPEDQITYAIIHLKKTNQAIDDWQGHGSISYQLGAYFPDAGGLPRAYWRRVRRQAGLGRDGPGRRIDYCGARSAVPAGVGGS